MRSRSVLACVIGVAIISTMAISARAGGDRGGESAGGPIGADAALCQLLNTRSWGRVGDLHSYSIRTNTWNVGDENLVWQEFTPDHPIMAQNIYRHRNGRLEQIGLSWVKHGFCALQQIGCGPCNAQAGCLDFLGVGCRDPYSANLNGNQMRLGPRSEVNASTGQFPYPYTLGWQQTGNAVYKRIQIKDEDIDPALNAGARYFIEGQIMHPQEGTTPRRHNNATYEEILPAASGNTYELGNGFNVVNQKPAIYAWKDIDPMVAIQAIDIPGTPVDGRFHLGFRVTNNGDGTWRYEYALHNLNSHRSAGGFTVQRNTQANVLNTYHRDVKYHSGEVYTNEDWTVNVQPNSVSWNGQTFSENPNANALRWATMFNFAILADTPPMPGTVTIKLFRPGTPDEVQVQAWVPGSIPPCPADIIPAGGDGIVNVNDLLAVINSWGPCPAPPTWCDADVSPIGGDGVVNVNDLLTVINSWGPCQF
jgi:hypothetical protein